ncbi:MAG: kinase [Lachnospiraceae bacterium]|nr:kinase [Lachnospiraceae bacterium]
MSKKKEKYIEKKGLLGNATDYAVLHPSVADYIIWFTLGAVAVAVLGYIFYESIKLSIFLGISGGLIFIPLRKRYVIEKRKKVLLVQFREMLESISTSLNSGKNIMDSFVSSRQDLMVQFPEDSDIVKEVNIINQGISNNLKIEDLLQDFAERSKLPDVIDFASVFTTCYNKGGNINEVIKNSVSIINDKIDIQMEIETTVTAQKNDQYVMLVMPVAFILAIKTMGGGLIDLSSAIGKISMTIAVVIFIIAYLIGKKILDIKI